ncbi:hypothetical protein SteCoe_35002 [Stentor coeruleus]|uniref:Ion transport domain-containing protein n=1 Tax=Stentor coeruleus TaxID=5963 RepID=A0A1R2ATA6_9CILI|nr:hypothetical protein SteCoe_35002 [Stentor coeruleus]
MNDTEIRGQLSKDDQLKFPSSIYSSKIIKISPSNEEKLEPNSILSSKKSLREEMQQICFYISQFKPSKIVTPFQGTWMLMSKDKSRFYFSNREGRIGIAKIDTKETCLDVDLEEGTIWTIALCNNDSYLFSGGKKGPIKKFSTVDMKQIDTYEGHTSEVNAILISSDERTMYSTGDDGTVLKWDITIPSSKPELLYTHNSLAYHMDLSVDNKFIATTSGERNVKVYSLEDKKIIKIIEEDFGTTWCVKITSSNTFIAFGDDRNLVYLYKFGSWERLRTFKGHTNRVRCINATHDERIIISGGIDNNIFLWDTLDKREGLLLEGHTNWVKTIIISPDNNFFYSLSDDCSIMTWRIPRFDYYTALTDSMPYNNVVAVYTGGRNTENLYMFSTTTLSKINRYGEMMSFNLTKKNYLHNIFNPKMDICCVISGNITRSYYYRGNNTAPKTKFTFEFYDVHNMILEKTETIDAYGIYSAMYSYDSKYIIIGEDRRCTILFANNLQVYHFFSSHKDYVQNLCQSPNCQLLFSSDKSGVIKSYDINGKKEIRSLIDTDAGVVAKMIVSSDNEFLIVLHKNYKVNIWATSKMIKVKSVIFHNVFDIQFIGNNNTLMCLYEKKLTAIEIPAFTCAFEIILNSVASYFAMSNDLTEIFFYQENGIFVYKNPYTVNTLSMYGDVSILNKYCHYIGRVASNKQETYEKSFNHWVIEPFHINAMHLYAYFNKGEFLEKALDDEAGFIISKSGYSPLDICLQMNNEDSVNLMFTKIKQESKKNPLFLNVLEKSLNRICMHGYSRTSKFLDIILCKSIDTTLQKFHHSNAKLPIILFSKELFTSKNSFMNSDQYSQEGQALQFLQTYFKMNMKPGSNESLDFIKSLILTENDSIFHKKFIQLILEEKWLRVRKVLLFQALIYLSYMALLSAYSSIPNWQVLISCFSLNIILILYEIMQIAFSGKDYFTDPWNYLDLIRSALMTLMFFQDLYNTGKYNDFLVAVVVFFTWIRGVSYFRLIKVTRYYINLLYEVIWDILPFLSILFYSTVAFCLIFARLDNLHETTFSFLTQSWEINVGGFDTAGYGKLWYLAFFFHTLLNPIVMLNLLISIMSHTFERVNSQIIVADSRELAGMILEGELLYFYRKNRIERTYLHVCTTLEVHSEENHVMSSLKEIKKKIGQLNTQHLSTASRLVVLEDTVRKIVDKIDDIKSIAEETRNLVSRTNT